MDISEFEKRRVEFLKKYECPGHRLSSIMCVLEKDSDQFGTGTENVLGQIFYKKNGEAEVGAEFNTMKEFEAACAFIAHYFKLVE